MTNWFHCMEQCSTKEKPSQSSIYPRFALWRNIWISFRNSFLHRTNNASNQCSVFLSIRQWVSSNTLLHGFLCLQPLKSVIQHVPHCTSFHIQMHNIWKASALHQCHQGPHSLQEAPRLLGGFAGHHFLQSAELPALSLRQCLLVSQELCVSSHLVPLCLSCLSFVCFSSTFGVCCFWSEKKRKKGEVKEKRRKGRKELFLLFLCVWAFGVAAFLFLLSPKSLFLSFLPCLLSLCPSHPFLSTTPLTLLVPSSRATQMWDHGRMHLQRHWQDSKHGARGTCPSTTVHSLCAPWFCPLWTMCSQQHQHQHMHCAC